MDRHHGTTGKLEDGHRGTTGKLQDGHEPHKLQDSATRQDLDPNTGNRHPPMPTRRQHQEPSKLQTSSNTQDTQKQSLKEKLSDWVLEQANGLKNCYCPCKELGKVGKVGLYCIHVHVYRSYQALLEQLGVISIWLHPTSLYIIICSDTYSTNNEYN